MKIEINNVSERKIDVTTRDFFENNEGFKDYIITHLIISYTLILSKTTLTGEVEMDYRKDITFDQINKYVEYMIRRELNATKF